MHYCLIERRGNKYEISASNEQEIFKEQFQTRNTYKQTQPKDYTDERRRPPLTRKEKRERAINRGDIYWTPGCGRILSIREK